MSWCENVACDLCCKPVRSSITLLWNAMLRCRVTVHFHDSRWKHFWPTLCKPCFMSQISFFTLTDGGRVWLEMSMVEIFFFWVHFHALYSPAPIRDQQSLNQNTWCQGLYVLVLEMQPSTNSVNRSPIQFFCIFLSSDSKKELYMIVERLQKKQVNRLWVDIVLSNGFAVEEWTQYFH